MAENKTFVPDAILSATSQEEGKFGISFGNIVFAENRGMTKQGKPYKAHQISFNVNAMKEAMDSGQLSVSDSGWVYVNFTILNEEQKAKIESGKAKKAKPAAKSGGFGGKKSAF